MQTWLVYVCLRDHESFFLTLFICIHVYACSYKWCTEGEAFQVRTPALVVYIFHIFLHRKMQYINIYVNKVIQVICEHACICICISLHIRAFQSLFALVGLTPFAVRLKNSILLYITHKPLAKCGWEDAQRLVTAVFVYTSTTWTHLPLSTNQRSPEARDVQPIWVLETCTPTHLSVPRVQTPRLRHNANAPKDKRIYTSSHLLYPAFVARSCHWRTFRRSLCILSLSVYTPWFKFSLFFRLTSTRLSSARLDMHRSCDLCKTLKKSEHAHR